MKKSLCILTVCTFIVSCSIRVEKNVSQLIGQQSLGKIISKNFSEITSSPFGLQAGTSDDTLLTKAAEIGVKWTRFLESQHFHIPMLRQVYKLTGSLFPSGAVERKK